MSLQEIMALQVAELAADDCHLWLWTTNQFLDAGFDVMRAWGFKYLAPIHWVKPSGCGSFFCSSLADVPFRVSAQMPVSWRSLPSKHYRGNAGRALRKAGSHLLLYRKCVRRPQARNLCATMDAALPPALWLGCVGKRSAM